MILRENIIAMRVGPINAGEVFHVPLSASVIFVKIMRHSSPSSLYSVLLQNKNYRLLRLDTIFGRMFPSMFRVLLLLLFLKMIRFRQFSFRNSRVS